MFGLVILVIGEVGLLVYGYLMLRAVSILHDSQRDYYDYLKRGGGQIKYLPDYYTKEDLKR